MNILLNSATNFKYITPLRAARAEAFLTYMLEEQCAIILDETLYKYWYEKGWNKEDVENAINDLAVQQLIRVNSALPQKVTMGLAEENMEAMR